MSSDGNPPIANFDLSPLSLPILMSAVHRASLKDEHPARRRRMPILLSARFEFSTMSSLPTPTVSSHVFHAHCLLSTVDLLRNGKIDRVVRRMDLWIRYLQTAMRYPFLFSIKTLRASRNVFRRLRLCRHLS